MRLKSIKYPKIQTLWKRDEKTHKIIEGDYSKVEFNAINRWFITEKIDGTNIRVIFERVSDPASGWQTPVVEFRGRTDDAQIPKMLQEYLEKTFKAKELAKKFPKPTKMILFGEGYGNKIQSVGKRYRKDNAFILFDVWIDGWWLEFYNVMEIANSLKIEHVPVLGIGDTWNAINYCKGKNKSSLSGEVLSEGIVATSDPLMLFRDGTPIKFKLKARDYR